VSSAAETVAQGVFFVAKGDKNALLSHLLADKAVARALVFTRTKHGADKVAKHLIAKGVVAEAIHGNKSQNARTRALDGFRSGKVRVLVASDIAARGLDVDGITHVVNVDLPNEPETYVHRIGRTGRAGAVGTAWSFCSGDERAFLRDIEKTIRRPVPVIAEHPFPDRGLPSTGGGGGGGFGGGQRGGGYDQRGGGFQRGGGGGGRRDFGGGGRREGHSGSGARDSGRGHGEGRGPSQGQGGGHRGQGGGHGGGQGGSSAGGQSGRGGRPARW
jgi:ATP-dependent RNA helicase RhlE